MHRTVSGGPRRWGRWPRAALHPLPTRQGPVVPDGPPELPRCFVREPQRLFVCLLPAASRGVRAEPGAAGAGKEARNVPGTESRRAGP